MIIMGTNSTSGYWIQTVNGQTNAQIQDDLNQNLGDEYDRLQISDEARGLLLTTKNFANVMRESDKNGINDMLQNVVLQNYQNINSNRVTDEGWTPLTQQEKVANKHLMSLADDLKRMQQSMVEYYDKHGSLEGITNEEMSKYTKHFEYDDIGKINKYTSMITSASDKKYTSAEYDEMLADLADSDLSDKAKSNLAKVLDDLKQIALEEEGKEPSAMDRYTSEEIDKILQNVKANMEQNEPEMSFADFNKLFMNM
ncbi:MAG: hypothetical protein ATN35_05995 [Epulopiscium sp. Nele67-Bin004]|nr:MAG: hypothetical protein ATN35_05995 [Epulopiscium sp. Nele67-Bin004]